MKKRIIVCGFLLLILLTAVVFSVMAADAYCREMASDNDEKFLKNFEPLVFTVVGGFVVFYECDLFYTVYYFFIRPKTITKSILNLLSNLSLVLIFFSGYLSDVFYRYFPIFKEEILVPIVLFLIYVVLRSVNAMIPACSSQPKKKQSGVGTDGAGS